MRLLLKQDVNGSFQINIKTADLALTHGGRYNVAVVVPKAPLS
jgi:hypothetical protein